MARTVVIELVPLPNVLQISIPPHKLFARMHSELYPFVFFSLQNHSNK